MQKQKKGKAERAAEFCLMPAIHSSGSKVGVQNVAAQRSSTEKTRAF